MHGMKKRVSYCWMTRALVAWVICSFCTTSYVSGFLQPSIVATAPAYTSRVRPVILAPSKVLLRRTGLNPLQFRTSDRDLVDRTATAVLDEEEIDDDGEEQPEDVYDSAILRILSKSILPLSVSVGFTVPQTSKIALRLAGAAAGGVFGIAAKNAIRSYARKPAVVINDGRFSDISNSGIAGSDAVRRALDQLAASRKPVTSMSLVDLEVLAKKSRVPEDQLSLLFTSIFAEVVYKAIQSQVLDPVEFAELQQFIVSAELTEAEVGDGLALTATKLSKALDRDERGFYDEFYSDEVLQQAAKLLFLSDKLLGVEEGYYGRRMIPALSFFMPEMYRSVITDACKDIFRRCVGGVLDRPRGYKSGQVQGLKDFLTVSPTVSELRPPGMQHMVREVIQLTLDAALPRGVDPMEASVSNHEAFLEAQPVLGWSPREWLDTLEERTLPLFEAAARVLFAQVCDKPERAAELAVTMKDRMDALHVDASKARVCVTALMSDRNKEYMDRIARVYNASGGAVEPAYKTMVSFAHTHDALKVLAAPVMQGSSLPMPGLPFPDMVRANIYQAQLTKTGGKDEGFEGVHGDMFSLNEAQRQVVRKHLALPKLASWVKQCIDEGTFNPSAKSAYQKQLAKVGVTEDEWTATSVDFYYQDVLKVSKARAVPSAEDISRLAQLSEFLGCPARTVAKVHLELFGEKYIKALTESMTPTGVITEEYVNGLARMRERLGLLESDAEALFSVAARARVSPIIKDLTDIWKSDTDASYRRDKEKKSKAGEVPQSDPGDAIGFMDAQKGAQKEGGGPNVFMREVLNLIDFLSENHKLLDRDVTELGELGFNAGGMATPEDLAGMFKHFVITALTEQDPALAERYAQAEATFGRVLGISPEGMMRVKESLAYTVYKNMLMGVLQREDTVDPRVTANFVMLRDKLSLSRDAADRVYKEATSGAMVEHMAQVVRASAKGVPLTSDSARRLRSQMESLALDWRADVGFSDPLISYLFALEVQDLVENASEDELRDLQSAYDIPDERAAAIVEATCKRYISQLLNLALRAAKKYDELDTVSWVKRILRYAPFVSSAVDADGNLFGEADKARLIEFYQTEAESGEDAELVELGERVGSAKEKLRDLINLTEDFVAPQQGIEGLLGNVKSLAQLGEDLNVDAGRKAWAWG